MNDPQRPIKINGVWNLWALYNPTFPSNGTSWRRWTSSDLVTWADRGISIPRLTTPYGDVWTGSTVIDRDNTAGFGAEALIALVTMPAPDAGGQNQSCALWYSLDGGATFTFHAIVLQNVPGHRAFRDPSVFWHEPTRRWVATISQEGKIGFYTSPNLRQWTYVSGFVSSAVGTVMECSQLVRLHLYNSDGSTTTDKWVLLVGGNGSASGHTIGTYYWIGDFDGITFAPTWSEGQWLDYGSDFYATILWIDPDDADPHAAAYAIAWQQNWNYAAKYPATNGYKGQLSIVRRLRLLSIDGVARLSNEPLPQQNKVFNELTAGRNQTIGNGTEYQWPIWLNSPACRIDFTLTRVGDKWPESATLSVRQGGEYGTDVKFALAENSAFLRRDRSGPRPTDSPHWSAVRTIPCNFSGGIAKVTLFVDASSVELFLNEGAASASSLITAPIGATGVALSAKGGLIEVSNLQIRC